MGMLVVPKTEVLESRVLIKPTVPFSYANCE